MQFIELLLTSVVQMRCITLLKTEGIKLKQEGPTKVTKELKISYNESKNNVIYFLLWKYKKALSQQDLGPML